MEPGLLRLECIINSEYNTYLMDIKARYNYKLSREEYAKDIKNLTNSLSFKIHGIQANEVAEDNKKHGCIDIILSNLIGADNKNIILDYATINNIESDSSCYLSNNLEPGIQANEVAEDNDTRDMIYTSLQTVLKICPWIKYFKLYDASRKNCSPGQLTTGVSLSCYYIALYRKTWYEATLNAKIENLQLREKYELAIKEFNNPSCKKNWESFDNFMFKGVKSLNYEIIKNTFDLTKTYSDFFDSLKQQIINKEELCLTLQPWIEDFIRLVIFKNDISILNEVWVVDEAPVIKFKSPWITSKEHNYLLNSQSGGNKRGYKIL